VVGWELILAILSVDMATPLCAVSTFLVDGTAHAVSQLTPLEHIERICDSVLLNASVGASLFRCEHSFQLQHGTITPAACWTLFESAMMRNTIPCTSFPEGGQPPTRHAFHLVKARHYICCRCRFGVRPTLQTDMWVSNCWIGFNVAIHYDVLPIC